MGRGITDKQRIDVLQWVVIIIGGVALIAFILAIHIGEEVVDLSYRVATLEATP